MFNLKCMVGSTVVLFVCVELAMAGDWPTYQHDNARSGVTDEPLSTSLSQQWVFRSIAPPEPAWPPPQTSWTELSKVNFDNAYYAVVDRDRVYFASSADYQIYALDAASGAVRWRFFVNAPVRLAPTLAGDKLFVGCDDGNVYCLRASDGTLLWSRTAATDSRQVLGNGHVVSMWPVRTSILVEGERVWCGAGVFPHHKTLVMALDARSGEVIWQNDSINNYGGFSPQGYLLAHGARLLVPSGRAPPVCLDTNTGEMVFSIPTSSGKGVVGGSYGTVVDGSLFVGTQGTVYGFSLDTGKPRGRWQEAEQLIATQKHYFVLKGSPPPAYGRRPTTGNQDAVTCYDRGVIDAADHRDANTLAQAQRWQFARNNLEAIIATGSGIVLGGNSEVLQLDEQGAVLWQAPVEGRAVGLAVAHGQLIVSTTSGSIHCFAPASAAGSSLVHRPVVKPSEHSPAVRNQADGIIGLLQDARGFALITGPNAAELACELARRTKLRFRCIESDSVLLPGIRRRVAETGLYGRVCVVSSTDNHELPFPTYAANLVVRLEPAPLSANEAHEYLRVLKPHGGVFLTTVMPPPEAVQVLQAAGDWNNQADGSRFCHLTRGELPGAGWWTHQYADAGGTGSSGDQRIKGQLDVLWFGEPGADEFADRHQRGMAPLVLEGRVYCQGWEFATKQATVFCFDAYNGVRYWKREVPDSLRLGLPTVAGNLACSRDSLFVVAGSQCHCLDARTGETRHSYEAPRDADGQISNWSFLTVADGRLHGGAQLRTGFSDRIFAYDLNTDELLWEIGDKEIRDTTVAYDDGRLFFVEKRDLPAEVLRQTPVQPESEARTDRRGQPIVNETYLRTVAAVDAQSGKVVWEQTVDLGQCGRWDTGTWGLLHAMCKDDVLVLAGAYTIYGRRTDKTPRRAMALSTKDGDPLWTSVVENRSRPILLRQALLAEPAFFDLMTGKELLKTQGNRQRPWMMLPRSGGCGTLSASESMVFGRGGYTIWRNIDGGPSGSFVGTRPGCAINIIPAGGVVVQAEASSGCSCYQAVQCTVVFQPRASK